MHGGVHLLEELHGLKIFPATVGVRCPATGRTRVVQVEHRGHRVDAQSVDVEFTEPVQRIGYQEVAHLGAAEVEYVGAPIELLAAARVGVLVEGGAVEPTQCPGILGEVRRYPINDHPDPGSVQGIDQEPKIVRGAEP